MSCCLKGFKTAIRYSAKVTKNKKVAAPWCASEWGIQKQWWTARAGKNLISLINVCINMNADGYLNIMFYMLITKCHFFSSSINYTNLVTRFPKWERCERTHFVANGWRSVCARACWVGSSGTTCGSSLWCLISKRGEIFICLSYLSLRHIKVGNSQLKRGEEVLVTVSHIDIFSFLQHWTCLPSFPLPHRDANLH